MIVKFHSNNDGARILATMQQSYCMTLPHKEGRAKRSHLKSLGGAQLSRQV